MNEIEVKIVDIDKDAIIKKLEAMGCQRVKDEAQVNTIYDFPDRRLLAQKGYARVREITRRDTGEKENYMTVKLMLSQDKYKIMDESETAIEDPEAAHSIFKALGLTVRKLLIKDRISYRYQDSLIEIDDVDHEEYPFPLLEIETQSEDQLKAIVDLLGYTMADTSSQTMSEIVAAKKAQASGQEG